MPSRLADLPYVIRKLIRSPVFTSVSVFTLAVGIGANTAIFSVVNGVLLKPLPFRDPASLVGVWHTAPGLGFPDVNIAPALYFTYREENRTFEDVGMWDDRQASVTGQSEPERVAAMNVTDGVFPLLGVQPAFGRSFTSEDDSPGSALTVILSWGYWQSHYGGDRSVIGRTLRIDGEEREIIGVMGERFRLMRSNPALYLPFRFDPATVQMGDFSYQGIARLKPGVTLRQADADIERMIPIAVERHPGGLTMGMLREARFGANLRTLKQDVVGDIGSVLWVLFGTVGLVLLIACANVANLFLVRAEGRQREIAIRTAMGASRSRVARQVLGESLVLGGLGGVGGLALAWGGLRILTGLAPDNLPRLEEIRLDPVVLGFALLLSVFAGLLFGIFPVLRQHGGNLVRALKEGGRGASDGKERHRLRGAIATAEVALALVLLIGAGLMVRSFQALRAVQPGFRDPGQVLTVRVSIPQAEVREDARVIALHEQILSRLSSIPGVASVGASSSITMDGFDSNDALYVEEFPTPPDQLPKIRRFKWMMGDYFGTMGNALVAGRSISMADIENRAPVVVISERLARDYWSDPSEAVGKRVRQGADQPWREVIGVVGDEHDDGVSQPVTPMVYWPMAIDSFWDSPLFVARSLTYAIRVPRSLPKSLLPQVRQAIWGVDPNLPLANVRTLDEILDASMARTSFTLIMLGIAAAVALVLGIVGIYGVIAYIVAQRTREIGVRMALGASGSDIRRLVLRQGVAYASFGTLAGLLAAAGLTRLMASLLYGVAPADTITYAGAAAAVIGVSLLATWIPATRAASVDPNAALRIEL